MNKEIKQMIRDMKKDIRDIDKIEKKLKKSNSPILEVK